MCWHLGALGGGILILSLPDLRGREEIELQRTGAYILLTHLAQGEEIEVGRLGTFLFCRGEYAYVGSAMGGLDARVARHLRAEKKLHWHIDYLLERASVTEGQTESEKVVGVRRFELPRDRPRVSTWIHHGNESSAFVRGGSPSVAA